MKEETEDGFVRSRNAEFHTKGIGNDEVIVYCLVLFYV